MALWFFSKVVWFVLAVMTWRPCWRACFCPPTWRPKLLLAYILFKFHSYAQMCCKRYHIIFSTFPLKFKGKMCVQREVIHNFKSHILVTWPFTNLFILRKWCGFEKPNHYYFKIWPTNRFSKAKSYTFHFQKRCHMPLSANGLSFAFCDLEHFKDNPH